MLILPLHRPLTLATFPLVTTLLIVLNVFVFVALQGGDGAAMQRLQTHYLKSDLGRYEVPAYERHLREKNDEPALAELARIAPELRAPFVAASTLTDAGFVARMERGHLFDDEQQLAQWRRLRAPYDALRDDVFTLRHVLRSSEIDVRRMLASAFLHGGVMHLVGNMIFLAALGILVEGALGAWRYAAVYLLGALGSSAVSLAWRWGEAGGGLGASGAIAALMGAFCLLWGREPVRFFYWFGVVFDYVRAPAIWLLPVWLGWEVYNLLANDDMGIGFDAHAGGLISGALLGAIAVGTRQVRREFIATDPAGENPRAARWQEAQVHLGRMQLTEADALLQALEAEDPNDIAVRVARFRAARLGGNRRAMQERAEALLACNVSDGFGAQQQREALEDLRAAQIAIADDRRIALARRWLALGQRDAAEAALRDAQAEPDATPRLASLWFALALARRDSGEIDAFRRTLDALITRYPQQPQAEKARFLRAELTPARPQA
jgi:membrane associated rhomboid family serine protease